MRLILHGSRSTRLPSQPPKAVVWVLSAASRNRSTDFNSVLLVVDTFQRPGSLGRSETERLVVVAKHEDSMGLSSFVSSDSISLSLSMVALTTIRHTLYALGMSARNRLLILLLLISPIILEESHLLLLRLETRWGAPNYASESCASRANGTTLNGSQWMVWRGGGSGGSNTNLTVVDSSGKRVVWWSNSELGYPEILVSNSSGETRFLCFQNYSVGSNHKIHENPSMIRYGIWLVEPGPGGYCFSPVVLNPVSLIAREPEFLLLLLEQLINW